MAIVGGNLETKEIGLPISMSGTHHNTEIDIATGYLKLIQTDVDGQGNPLYAEEGSWTSDVINLGDKFYDFEKVFTTHTHNASSSFGILTRVSENGVDWSEWTPIAMDGTIQSETKQYIQIKINLFAGFVTDLFVISNFNRTQDVSLFEDNFFIETTNGLRLKRDYKFKMKLDNTWSDEGYLLRKKITHSDWTRIDKIRVGY